MGFDFGSFEASLLANAVLLTPVEVAVVMLVVRIYREVGKLAALYQMVPDMSAEDRRFAAWWMKDSLETTKRLAILNLKPGTRPPWEV